MARVARSKGTPSAHACHTPSAHLLVIRPRGIRLLWCPVSPCPHLTAGYHLLAFFEEHRRAEIDELHGRLAAWHRCAAYQAGRTQHTVAYVPGETAFGVRIGVCMRKGCVTLLHRPRGLATRTALGKLRGLRECRGVAVCVPPCVRAALRASCPVCVPHCVRAALCACRPVCVPPCLRAALPACRPVCVLPLNKVVVRVRVGLRVVGHEHDVLGLDVPMADAARVQMIDGTRHLDAGHRRDGTRVQSRAL